MMYEITPTFPRLLGRRLLLLILTPGLAIIHIRLLLPKNTSTDMHVHCAAHKSTQEEHHHQSEAEGCS